MTDITSGAGAPRAAALLPAALRRATADLTRDEINAFGGIAALVAVLLGAFVAFGLPGLGVVYVALVPVCMVLLCMITAGG